MSNKADEQTFGIQPHPATTNDPETDPALRGGANTQLTGHSSLLNPGEEVHAMPGHQVPHSKVLEGLEKPKSKEEVEALVQSLNAPK